MLVWMNWYSIELLTDNLETKHNMVGGHAFVFESAALRSMSMAWTKTHKPKTTVKASEGRAGFHLETQQASLGRLSTLYKEEQEETFWNSAEERYARWSLSDINSASVAQWT